MNINYLIEYVYLAEMLSFRRTADYFYVSRSVISRHLAALEETIGTTLIDRGSRSVQLTEAGKVFYREARTVLRAYADAVDRTREAGRSLGHAIRIGYLRNAARPIIVQFARFMQHEHPSLRLQLDAMEFTELRSALEKRDVDIALAVNVHPSISRHYRSTPIYTDRLFAVMSKDHPLASRTQGVPFAELPPEKLLLPDSFVYSGMAQVIDGLSSGQARSSARDYYRDVDMLYLKVQTEGYVALSSSLNNVIFGDRLAILPITGIDTAFTVSAFYGDRLDDEAYEACRKGFESCRAAIGSMADASYLGSIGFSQVN